MFNIIFKVVQFHQTAFMNVAPVCCVYEHHPARCLIYASESTATHWPFCHCTGWHGKGDKLWPLWLLGPTHSCHQTPKDTFSDGMRCPRTYTASIFDTMGKVIVWHCGKWSVAYIVRNIKISVIKYCIKYYSNCSFGHNTVHRPFESD